MLHRVHHADRMRINGVGDSDDNVPSELEELNLQSTCVELVFSLEQRMLCIFCSLIAYLREDLRHQKTR